MDRASISKLKAMIGAVPKEGLHEILATVVRECVTKKVFGERKVGDIVTTMEKQLKGQVANSPNQSPKPSQETVRG